MSHTSMRSIMNKKMWPKTVSLFEDGAETLLCLFIYMSA